MTHSAASQSVAEMRRRGLVELGAGADARERLVQLTDTTLAMKAALDAEWEATEIAYAALNAELSAPLSQVVERTGGGAQATLVPRSHRRRRR